MDFSKKSTYELKVIKKALSSPVSLFFNTPDDSKRLLLATQELNRRSTK